MPASACSSWSPPPFSSLPHPSSSAASASAAKETTTLCRPKPTNGAQTWSRRSQGGASFFFFAFLFFVSLPPASSASFFGPLLCMREAWEKPRLLWPGRLRGLEACLGPQCLFMWWLWELEQNKAVSRGPYLWRCGVWGLTEKQKQAFLLYGQCHTRVKDFLPCGSVLSICRMQQKLFSFPTTTLRCSSAARVRSIRVGAPRVLCPLSLHTEHDARARPKSR